MRRPGPKPGRSAGAQPRGPAGRGGIVDKLKSGVASARAIRAELLEAVRFLDLAIKAGDQNSSREFACSIEDAAQKIWGVGHVLNELIG